jgi:V/A-type H+/Na+-transporting ATPase subunit D
MKINLAATKTNLFKVKKNLELSQEGFELLDEKRRILMSELTTIVHITQSLQHNVDDALKQAYELMDKTIVLSGRKKIEELAFAINIKSRISVTQKKVMGVNLPVIDLNITENTPFYSPHDVSFLVDESILKFKEVLKLITKLAEKKISLLRLAKEVQKTIRKVNALEKVHIPNFRASLKFINDRLDEESREAFSMSKLIKKRIKT